MSKEIRARIEKASYQTFLDRTEITVTLPGEHDIVRGELVVLVVSEGACWQLRSSSASRYS